jgi:hypothetical protein
MRDDGVASVLSRNRAEFGTVWADRLAGYWRPADQGPEAVSGIMEWTCTGLAATLGLAIEMDNPRLIMDELDWMTDLLLARGYDPAAILRTLLDACSVTCQEHLDPLVWTTRARPILEAGREAINLWRDDG